MQVAQVHGLRRKTIRKQFSSLDTNGKNKFNDSLKWGIIQDLAKNKDYND